MNDRWYVFGRQLRVYAPMECVNLPAHFASMPLDTFIAFYGALGWLLAPEGHAAMGHDAQRWFEKTKREQLDLQDEVGLAAIGAEPVEWIEAHRAGVAWCLRAGAVLAMPHDTRAELSKCEPLYDQTRLEVPQKMGFGNVVSRPWTLIGPKFGPRERLGRQLEIALVGNLRGVRRWPVFEDGRLRTTWGTITLVDSIYSLLADALTGDQLKICEHCKKPFVQTDKRQRFCPSTREGAKSTCMNTALVRRKRAKAAGLATKAAPKQTVRQNRG